MVQGRDRVCNYPVLDRIIVRKENNRVGGRREQRKRRRGGEIGWRGVEETKAKSKGSRSDLTKIRNKKKHRGIPQRNV